jgi:ribosomal-protein-alanine N-acetyltransferase
MPGGLQIRPYTQGDETQVVRLWEAVFPDNPPWNVPAEDIRRKLAVQRSLFLIGERGGEIVGTVMAGFDGHRGWIHRMAVLPEYHRRGFARALMMEAERRLRSIGCTKVNLQVRSSNTGVVAFYERIGYAVEDRVSMGKLLVQPTAEATSPERDARQARIVATEDIHLSPLRPIDKSALVEWLNEKEIFDGTLRIPFPYTEQDAEKGLGMAREAAARYGHPVRFAIREPSERLIGMFGFEGLAYGHRAEIGYWLAKPYWGQGIMTDVVRAMCDFAFAEWDLVRIEAHTFAFNVASARVLEKNGFQFEGLLRKHRCKNGRFLDSRLYALTR